MAEYQIIKTNPNEPDFELFTSLIGRIYPHDSLRFKQPDSFNFEYLSICLVVLQNNHPVARCAVYFNPFLRHQNRKTCCIGNFEAENNPEAVRLMTQYVKNLASTNGYQCILGPMNGSTWDAYRLKINTDSASFFEEPVQMHYYPELFEFVGFKPIANYFTYKVRQFLQDENRAQSIAQRFQNEGLTIRKFDPTKFDSEIRKIFEFSQQAFSRNKWFTPIGFESFYKKYKKIEKQIDPDFLMFAQSKTDATVGFVFGFPDFFDASGKQFIGKTIAVSPERKWAGLGILLENHLSENVLKRGYTSMLHAFIIENSISANISGRIADCYASYRLYSAEI